MPDWGTNGLESFIKTHHTTVPPSLHPSASTHAKPYTVLILGATGKIGSGIAKAYAAASATTLILCSRRPLELESTKAACLALKPDIHVEVAKVDITVTADFERLVQVVVKSVCGGVLDAVVVNSGFSGPVVTDVRDDDLGTVRRVAETNYFGTYYAAHFLLPFLIGDGSASASAASASAVSGSETGDQGQGNSRDGKKRRRRRKAFLVIGSNASFIVRGPIANTQYCVSKLAQLKLVEHIHEQHSGSGLLAVAIHPGAVLSEMAAETCPDEFREFLTDSGDLAGAYCVWLTRDERDEDEDKAGKDWLGGRHVVAKWDVDELMAKKEEIVQRDLFKAKISL